MMKSLFFCATLFLFSFLVAFSQEYRAIPLIHPAGNLFVSGLNNQGQVCGTVLVDDVNFFNNAVRFEPDGTFSTLALGDLGQSSTASAINDLGHVLGTISRSDFATAVVIWESDSTYRELEQPDGFASVLPQDLNNKGEAVGYIFNFGGANEAIFWDSNGVLGKLPQPEDGAEAQVLNDSSEIVGKIYHPDSTVSLVTWVPIDTGSARSDHPHEIDGTLGGPFSKANLSFFNNDGLSGGSFDGRAFLHDNETGLTDLGPGEINSANRWGDYSGFLGDGPAGPQPTVIIGGVQVSPQTLTTEEIIFGGLITDRTLLHGADPSSTDYFMVPNFNYKINATVGENLALNIFPDFNSSVTNQLDASFSQSPSIFPLIFDVCAGNYVSESWNLMDKWSVNIGLRLDDETMIQEITVGSVEQIEWMPRLVLQHDLAEERPSVSVQSFLNQAEHLILDVNLEVGQWTFESTTVQEVEVRDPAQVFVENLKANGIRLNVIGNPTTKNLEITSGTVSASGQESGLSIENTEFDKFAFDSNLPLPGSPFSVTDENNFIEGRIERVAPLTNPWSIPEPDCGFYFGLGLDGEPTPVIVQPAETGLGASETVISAEVMDIANTPIDPSASFMIDNYMSQFIEPRVYRLQVGFRFNQRDVESVPIVTHLRVPFFGEEVDDPTVCRLLMFDCTGNLLGFAGDFLAPSDDPPSSIAYTGSIDGVFNLTHTNVMLDSCQYITVARGMMTTSLSEKSGWDRGFQFRSVYPNPSLGSAYLDISIPRVSDLRGTLYDMMGKAVWSNSESRATEGAHSLSIGDLDLLPGVYHCQIEFSDPYGSDFHYIQSKKLILLE